MTWWFLVKSGIYRCINLKRSIVRNRKLSVRIHATSMERITYYLNHLELNNLPEVITRLKFKYWRVTFKDDTLHRQYGFQLE